MLAQVTEVINLLQHRSQTVIRFLYKSSFLNALLLLRKNCATAKNLRFATMKASLGQKFEQLRIGVMNTDLRNFSRRTQPSTLTGRRIA